MRLQIEPQVSQNIPQTLLLLLSAWKEGLFIDFNYLGGGMHTHPVNPAVFGRALVARVLTLLSGRS